MKPKGKLLPVRVYGDDILRQKLPECDLNDPALQEFIPDLIYTMYQRDGVGLAANQVGNTLRVFVIDPGISEEDAVPNPTVMINPIIETREGEIQGDEGCISLPGIFAAVTRAKHITYSYTDITGQRITESAQDYKAVVIQHEYDHLEGILFTDHLGTLAKLKVKRHLKELASTAVNGINIREKLPSDE